MLDTLICNGLVVDGTGAPSVRTDVGIRDGRIVSMGATDEPAAQRIDAEGLVVAPGFIDPHTHYDCQLHWDPHASPSNLHGVTTVIGGNCGFSIAPLGASDADYIRRMMSVVEGMPLEALESGIDWNWSSFGQWLDSFSAGLGVNAGFLVGHCAVRRCVLGAEAGREATAEEIERMVALLRRSIEEGGLGFSTSLSFTHKDGDGAPVPSRFASREEVLALCRALRPHEGTSLEFITSGCLEGFSSDEIDLMAQMSLAADRPLNWNVFSIDSREPERYARHLEASAEAERLGGRVVALTMPVLVGLTVSFATFSPIHHFPDWGPILSLPIPERIAALRDPETRRRMKERAESPDAGVFGRFTDWGNYRIGETFSAENVGLSGKRIAEIATQRKGSDFDTLLEVAIADGLRTVLWPNAPDDDDASWDLRVRAWRNDYTLLGGSDAGAHLDRMCGAPYTTQFLADCLRGRRLLPLEEAVAAMTDAPAQLFGLRSRGRIAVGYAADLVLMDPETVGSGPIRAVGDLPGDSSRLVAPALGIERVFVNGRAVVVAGSATGDLPGGILRSGRDTRSVGLGRDVC